MRGNCLTYALGMWLAEGFTGRVKLGVVWAGRVPKLRFYYVNTAGESTYLFPRHPKTGLAACYHALWFTDAVVKRNV